MKDHGIEPQPAATPLSSCVDCIVSSMRSLSAELASDCGSSLILGQSSAHRVVTAVGAPGSGSVELSPAAGRGDGGG